MYWSRSQPICMAWTSDGWRMERFWWKCNNNVTFTVGCLFYLECQWWAPSRKRRVVSNGIKSTGWLNWFMSDEEKIVRVRRLKIGASTPPFPFFSPFLLFLCTVSFFIVSYYVRKRTSSFGDFCSACPGTTVFQVNNNRCLRIMRTPWPFSPPLLHI